jgi:hypothetical protein
MRRFAPQNIPKRKGEKKQPKRPKKKKKRKPIFQGCGMGLSRFLIQKFYSYKRLLKKENVKDMGGAPLLRSG